MNLEIIKDYSIDSTLKINNEKSLLEENTMLKMKIIELEDKLKKYTNGSNHKRYYEKNKEKIKESGSNYLQKLKIENPERLKEYSKRAYENKKKKKLENMVIQNTLKDTNEPSQPINVE
jgi:hypothetical protein